MYKVNFAGNDLEKVVIIEKIKRSILPTRENFSKNIPTIHGSVYTGYKYSERVIELEIGIVAKSKEEFVVSKNNSCSMLMNGFTSEMITKIGNVMRREFEKNKDNLMDYEMLLPDIMDESIKEGKTILDIPTDSIWVGMTYKEDAEYLKEFILKEIEKGVYPKDLWN